MSAADDLGGIDGASGTEDMEMSGAAGAQDSEMNGSVADADLITASAARSLGLCCSRGT